MRSLRVGSRPPKRPYPSSVPGNDTSPWDRAAELDRIRASYARYDREGRSRLWDTSNRGYARLSRQLRDRLIEEMRASLQPNGGGRLLDLGCGTGELLDVARSAGMTPEWVGVDLRSEVIEAAQRRFPDGTFVVASADDVPEPDGSFDVVIAQLIFSSLPSTALERAVVAEITRLLRTGGWLVWSDVRYANPSNRAVHRLNESRIRRLFRGWTVRLGSVGLLPPLARRLGVATPVAYPALTAIPLLRSHLVGRLQPPPGS